MAAASIRYEACERQARARVGDHGRAGMLLQDDGGHEGDELVAVDGIAVLIDHAAAVDVRVKHDPEVGVVFEDGGTS